MTPATPHTPPPHPLSPGCSGALSLWAPTGAPAGCGWLARLRSRYMDEGSPLSPKANAFSIASLISAAEQDDDDEVEEEDANATDARTRMHFSAVTRDMEGKRHCREDGTACRLAEEGREGGRRVELLPRPHPQEPAPRRANGEQASPWLATSLPG